MHLKYLFTFYCSSSCCPVCRRRFIRPCPLVLNFIPFAFSCGASPQYNANDCQQIATNAGTTTYEENKTSDVFDTGDFSQNDDQTPPLVGQHATHFHKSPSDYMNHLHCQAQTSNVEDNGSPHIATHHSANSVNDDGIYYSDRSGIDQTDDGISNRE